MHKMLRILSLLPFLIMGFCSVLNAQVDPKIAPQASIDRFSAAAGHLFVRDETNGLPGPNEPIDFDREPFVTKGLGPDGEFVAYYNFDVMPTEPAPIFVLFREGESAPVDGQMNIIDVLPGDEGYSDFWEVQKVTVPADYVANSVTSFAEIIAAGYPIEETVVLVNCPVVPEGSTAKLRLGGESPELTQGWYKGEIVYYFNFSEKALSVDGNDMVPLSPIYVTFNINPDQPGGGPASGFVQEEATGRTHNVVATLPDDESYSPLWRVNVYDNAEFMNVHDLVSAQAASILATGVANVNCPIVALENPSSVEENTGATLTYVLDQNYPNPFNPETEIHFQLPEATYVTLRIYNMLGRELATIIAQQLNAGNHRVVWDGKDRYGNALASGVYLYQLKAGSFSQVKKMSLLR